MKLTPIWRQRAQFALGLLSGAISSFFVQDRHGSKQAYIEYIQAMPEAWDGWVQFPLWTLYTSLTVVLLLSNRLEKS